MLYARLLFLNFIYLIYFCLFQDVVSLCNLGCPGTHCVDQAGLEHFNLSASASQMLGLKASATTALTNFFFFFFRNLPKVKGVLHNCLSSALILFKKKKTKKQNSMYVRIFRRNTNPLITLFS